MNPGPTFAVPPPRPPPDFVRRHRVGYADCTVGNHVYYARYLDWFEEARTEFFLARGTSFARWAEQGFLFPVVRVEADYRRAARAEDEVETSLRVAAVGRASFSIACEVRRVSDGHLLVEGQTVHAVTDAAGRTARMPPALRQMLEGTAPPA